MRKFTMNAAGTAVGFVLVAVAVPAQAQVTPAPDEVQIGPVDVTQDVQGVPVSIPVTSFVSISTSPQGLKIKMRTFGNLGDLQGKIGSIVDKVPLPRDNCRSFSANNPVVRIPTKDISVNGNALVFSIGADVDLWDCRENPIPNTKVVWVNDGPFGLPRPKIESWPGSPIKNHLLSQPVKASVPITLARESDSTVQVKLGSADVQLGGNPVLSVVRDALLSLFRVDINGMANKAIAEAVDPRKLVYSLPDDITRFKPRVTQAQFLTISGVPGVQLNAEADIAPANMTDILKLIADKDRPRS